MSTVTSYVRYRNPYLQLTLTALLIAAAEVFLKEGAALSQDDTGVQILGISALGFRATWFGIAFHILAFLSWLSVLRLMPLVEAFALLNVVHVLVPVASSVFLKEGISLMQVGGIAMVLAGTFLVGSAAAKAGDRL